MASQRTLAGHENAVCDVAFAPDGALLASVDVDGLVRLWRTADGALLRTLGSDDRAIAHATLDGHQDAEPRVCFTLDGRSLLAWAAGLWLWRVDAGIVLREPTEGDSPGDTEEVVESGVAFAPDGGSLAWYGRVHTGGNSSIVDEVRLLRFPDLAPLSALRQPGIVTSVALAPDARALAVGLWDDGTVLWRARRLPPDQGHEVAWGARDDLTGHAGSVTCLAFAPGGHMLASGSADRTVRLWRVEDGRPLRTLALPSGATSLAFALDAQMLVTGTADGTIQLWRVVDGGLVRAFTDWAGEEPCVAISPDSRMLAVGDVGGQVHLQTLHPTDR